MNLCGIDINCRSVDELITKIGNKPILVTVNAEAIVRAQNDLELKKIINQSLTTIDGQIPLWLYQLKYGRGSCDKVSGSDLIYILPSYASKRGLKVFLLGGKEDSNKKAVTKLEELHPTLSIKGFSPPYHPYPFPNEMNRQILCKIDDFQPDILFVGFGMGKQELWAYENINELLKSNIKLIIGCGGSFEFVSGMIKRAPKVIQNMGLEGFWRLINEFKWFRIKRLLISTKIFYYFFRH